MFTGIIEEIGRIKSIERFANGAGIEVFCNTVLSDAKIGDSISINGVCETATDYTESGFKAKISEETLKVTTFNNLKTGDYVNLERAMAVNSRFGGHIVSGHIDCVGKITEICKLSEFYDLKIKVPAQNLKYVVYKGSITLNGISLTVAEVNDDIVKIAIIPHTFENTNLKYLKTGDFVNVETDILARYVEKLLSVKDNKTEISMKFLQENGFV